MLKALPATEPPRPSQRAPPNRALVAFAPRQPAPGSLGDPFFDIFFGPLRGNNRPTGWRPPAACPPLLSGAGGCQSRQSRLAVVIAKVIGSLLEEMPKAANGGVLADLMSFFLHGRRDQPGEERSKTAAPPAKGNTNRESSEHWTSLPPRPIAPPASPSPRSPLPASQTQAYLRRSMAAAGRMRY